MKTSAAVTVLTIAAAALSSSCGEKTAPAPASGSAVAPPPSASLAGKKTTNWTIAVKNLEYGVTESERRIKLFPHDPSFKATAIGILGERMNSLGKVSDLDRILELGEKAVADAPTNPKAHLTRASALAAAHRFGDALAATDEAVKLGEDPLNTRAKRGSILLAVGKYEEACKLLREEREVHASAANLTMEAACLAATGKIDDAEALFVEAEQKSRSVSPFTLSWIWFERANMWERAGDVDKAKDLYRSILDRLPVHAHAAGHLAQLVPPAEAEAILQPVLAASDDPMTKAILGLAKERVAAGSGKTLVDEAKAGYDALLAKHPLAFSDHAGWFFLHAVKDPARAAEVAEANLKNRGTHQAYELALAALPAAGRKERACELADQAMAFAHKPEPLLERIAAAYEACGKPDKAAAARSPR